MQIQDQVIAVTGAFGVLGRATAQVLGAAGAKLALLDQAPAAGADDPGRLSIGGVDLSDPAATGAAFAKIVAHYGRLDGLVNIAGGYRWEPVGEGDLSSWQWLQKINLGTAVSACKAALPHLLARGAGRIVNIGAIGALKAGAGNGPYAASKAGVHRLTEALAEELKDRGIQVNAVLPSIIDTPANRRDMPNADHSRWVAPEAIAEVILFLLSPAARAITGALIPVPGRT